MQLYMSTVTSSTRVTGHHDTVSNGDLCDTTVMLRCRICIHVIGSVVDSSLATRRVRVRFLDDTDYIFVLARRKNTCDT